MKQLGEGYSCRETAEGSREQKSRSQGLKGLGRGQGSLQQHNNRIGVAGKQPTSKSAAGRTWREARCRGSPFLTPVLDFLNAWNCFQLRNIKHHGFCKFVVFFLINLELIWLSLGSSGKSKVSRESQVIWAVVASTLCSAETGIVQGRLTVYPNAVRSMVG